MPEGSQESTGPRPRDSGRASWSGELGGACGDLGTFVPLVVGAMTVGGAGAGRRARVGLCGDRGWQRARRHGALRLLELSQVRDRIAELMGETVTPALHAAGDYAGESAAQARRLAREQPLTVLAIADGIGFLLGLAVARAGESAAHR